MWQMSPMAFTLSFNTTRTSSTMCSGLEAGGTWTSVTNFRAIYSHRACSFSSPIRPRVWVFPDHPVSSPRGRQKGRLRRRVSFFYGSFMRNPGLTTFMVFLATVPYAAVGGSCCRTRACACGRFSRRVAADGQVEVQWRTTVETRRGCVPDSARVGDRRHEGRWSEPDGWMRL